MTLLLANHRLKYTVQKAQPLEADFRRSYYKAYREAFCWGNIPANDQERLHMERSTIALITESGIRKNLSDLIYHEKTSDGSYLCYYKNLASDNPITYLCNTGCCTNGCCALQEVKMSGGYNLIVILLLIFVFAVLFTAAAMLIIYYIYNRKSDERGYEFSGSFTSVTGSQVNGPPMYFGERRYLPHVSPVKSY